MKRIVKYRGKRLDNGEWVYGYYFINGEGKHIIYADLFYEVVPETVAEFTGEQDYKGNDIYENDIIRVPHVQCDHEEITGLVCFINASFIVKSLSGGTENIQTAWGTSLPSCVHDHATVIGNIYDNPDMLE